ncbi:MAG: hypothetical protein WBX26_09780 [Candidatus Cybelea sp.]
MRISRLLPALLAAVFIITLPVPAPAQFAIGVGVTVGVPPPPIPVYTIPVAPDPNYMYTPGYWGWGGGGYYWVPGVWVAAPAVGVYWTPGYWGSYGGAYRWNAGYWGPRVGFYGGINYGFGYYGAGFVGGVWAGGGFRYNTAVWPVNRTYIHNTYYNKTIVNNYYNHSRVSYNGGHGGIAVRPTPAERSAWASRRYGPTPEQVTHARYASQDRTLYAKTNGGHPPVTATTHAYNANNRPAHYGTVSHGTTVTHYNGTTHTATHYNGTTHSTTHYNANTHTATHYNGTTHTTTHYSGTTHAQPATASHPSQGNEGHKPPKH